MYIGWCVLYKSFGNKFVLLVGNMFQLAFQVRHVFVIQVWEIIKQVKFKLLERLNSNIKKINISNTFL